MTVFSLERIEDGHIVSPRGFEAAGVSAGIKANDALDVALVCSKGPCTAAAVFTRNAFQAAPVVYDREVLAANPAGLRAVAINSGCANACTGERGMADARETASTVADALGIAAQDVMVMSTGVIGAHLPMDRLLPGVRAAAAQCNDADANGHAAARAIMTTDTRPKEIAVRVTSPAGTFTVAGMAKGAGMIHPNMATLLSVVTTDAAVAPEIAQQFLSRVVEESFNLITIDGDTSTNDTLLLMANGQAEMETITGSDSPAYDYFERALTEVLVELAKGIVRDGEGATRFIEITVEGARSRTEAKQVAMSVATSSLFKTAIYGQDANWGRIICAVGYSDVPIAPNKVGVWLGNLELVRDGAPYDVDEEQAAQILARPEIPVHIDLGLGDAEVTVWTADLSHEYVDINAHYRT